MIYIVTSTRNRKGLTLGYVEAINNQSFSDYKIIIVDDGSEDGTPEALAMFENVHVIRGDGNLWWSGATRIGVEYALSESISTHDYILIQNDDTYFDSDFLIKLIKYSEENDRAIIASTVSDFSSKEILYNSCRLVNGVYRPFIDRSNSHLIPTDTMGGRGVLVPIEVFNKIGNFSKLLPHYGSDYDFFCKAKKSGFKLYYVRDVITYNTSSSPGVSKRIQMKSLYSIKDFYNLYFNRRSSSNIWSSLYVTIVHAPGIYKIIGTLRILAVMAKFLIIEIPKSHIVRIKKK